MIDSGAKCGMCIATMEYVLQYSGEILGPPLTRDIPRTITCDTTSSILGEFNKNYRVRKNKKTRRNGNTSRDHRMYAVKKKKEKRNKRKREPNKTLMGNRRSKSQSQKERGPKNN